MRRHLLPRLADLFPWACVAVAVVALVAGLHAWRRYTEVVEAAAAEDFGPGVQAEGGQYEDQIRSGRPQTHTEP